MISTPSRYTQYRMGGAAFAGTVHDSEMCVGPTLADSTGADGAVFAGSVVALAELLYPDQFNA
jgi:hypothetical protein